MASNEVWGIDIGKSGVKAVKMRKAKNQLEVVAIDIIEYEQALSESEDVDREEQIRQALGEFQARNKIKSSDCIFASIPGQATFNRLITIPPVEAKRIKEVVTYEAQQQIPFPIEDVIWDYQLIGSVDSKNVEEREVMLFAVRKELINNFLGNLEAAQLPVQGIQIAPLALYNFVRFERPEMEAGVAIDIGAEHTDLVIVDLDKLWLRAVPYAGDDITKALQKRFKIPYSEAEKLKIKSGKTKQSQRIFEVMKPILKDLVGEVHRSVGYYKSSMSKNIKFEKMLFVGNATKLNGFEQFFTQNMQYNIEILSQVKNIHVSPKINVNQFQSNIATFAVALGLAIQGLGKAKNDIKLIPSEISIVNNFNKIKPFLVAATALLCVAPILEYQKAKQTQEDMLKLSQNISPIISKIKTLQDRLKKVDNYGSIQEELKKVSVYGQGRDVWLTTLNLLNEQYLETSQKVQSENKPKFWIVKTSAEKKQVTSTIDVKDPKDDRKTIKKNIVKKQLLVQFTVVFKTVAENSLGNNDYLSNYLVVPLRKKCKETYKNENFGTIDILEGSWGFVAGVFPNSSDQEEKNHFKVTIKWILNLGEQVMEQLKNNQFAVAIAAIIFVYVILYMFVVSPIYTDGQRGIEILKRKLNKDKRHLDEYANPRAIIPSEELIKYHTQKKEELIAAKKKIYDIFISKSQSLKKSFKEVKEKEEQDGNVSLSYFQLVYEKEVSNIVKKYANESGGLKIGESKEDDFFDGVSSKEKQVREILRFDDSRSIVSTTTQAEAQKKFWIIQNILGIMEASKVKSLKQLLVRKNDSPSYPGFEEYNIEMTINVDFKNMPSIVQKILQSEEMLTEISFVNMSRNESYTPEDITVFVKIGQTEQQAQDEELKKKGISSIPVSVRIGCKVLNYIQPEK